MLYASYHYYELIIANHSCIMNLAPCIMYYACGLTATVSSFFGAAAFCTTKIDDIRDSLTLITAFLPPAFNYVLLFNSFRIRLLTA